MLGSITPLGERGRNSRWGVTMAAFALGGLGGGAVIGGALGLLGGATLPGRGGRAALAALGALILAGVLFDLRWLPVHLPSVRRQVDERWLRRYRGWVYGFGFGAQLGMGFVTVVVVSAVYAAFAAAALSGSVTGGAAIGGAFGVTRSASVLAAARVRRPEQLAVLDARVRALDRPSRRASIAVEIALAGVALAVAFA